MDFVSVKGPSTCSFFGISLLLWWVFPHTTSGGCSMETKTEASNEWKGVTLVVLSSFGFGGHPHPWFLEAEGGSISLACCLTASAASASWCTFLAFVFFLWAHCASLSSSSLTSFLLVSLLLCFLFLVLSDWSSSPPVFERAFGGGRWNFKVSCARIQSQENSRQEGCSEIHLVCLPCCCCHFLHQSRSYQGQAHGLSGVGGIPESTDTVTFFSLLYLYSIPFTIYIITLLQGHMAIHDVALWLIPFLIADLFTFIYDSLNYY